MMICCADIGSVANGRFGWAGHSGEPDREGWFGTDIGEFAQFVADRLAIEEKVSLGFECPLWIPVANEPSRGGAPTRRTRPRARVTSSLDPALPPAPIAYPGLGPDA